MLHYKAATLTDNLLSFFHMAEQWVTLVICFCVVNVR